MSMRENDDYFEVVKWYKCWFIPQSVQQIQNLKGIEKPTYGYFEVQKLFKLAINQ
jgi:hypothetical protein